ncbi:MAG TPA: hypothetical protein VMN39_01870 [Longimicrobiaceae bacterium]|nr:hypothetical protein [Longimicrobiaceae bacterium]
MTTILLASIQVGQAAPAGGGLSTGALAFMLLSMGAVIALTAWCFSRILRTKEHFDPDGTGPARPPVPGEEDVRGGA